MKHYGSTSQQQVTIPDEISQCLWTFFLNLLKNSFKFQFSYLEKIPSLKTDTNFNLVTNVSEVGNDK